MHIDEYSAWICIEGLATPVYEVKRESNSASCWIASQIGRKFSVNWYNASRQYPVQATVIIDGNVCDNHIMLDAQRYPNKPSGVGISYARTSDWTRRDFQFSSILVSDDDSYLDTVQASVDIGTISLQIWRIEVQEVVSETLKHRYGAPTLDDRIVHERSKKAGAHHVTYGDEYASPAPTVDMVRGRTIDTTPIATFTFKYRPYDILLASDIIPRPSSTQVKMDEKTAAKIKRLENRISVLKTQAKLSGTSGIQKNSAKQKSARRAKGRSSFSVPLNADIIDLTL
ncbi:hypothetical protein MD484_g605, partial [Candolleomyces efflorescens]